MKAIGLSLILLCSSLLAARWARADGSTSDNVVKNMPYDPKGIPLSVSVDAQKKQLRQKAKAKKIVDEVLGPEAPVPPAKRTPDAHQTDDEEQGPGTTN
jgi:hypothetical protein